MAAAKEGARESRLSVLPLNRNAGGALRLMLPMDRMILMASEIMRDDSSRWWTRLAVHQFLINFRQFDNALLYGEPFNNPLVSPHAHLPRSLFVGK